MTKKEIKEFIVSMGCTVAYSGKSRTMFIKGENAIVTELAVLKKFKGMRFNTQSVVPKKEGNV